MANVTLKTDQIEVACKKCGAAEFTLEKDRFSDTVFVVCRNCYEEAGILS